MNADDQRLNVREKRYESGQALAKAATLHDRSIKRFKAPGAHMLYFDVQDEDGRITRHYHIETRERSGFDVRLLHNIRR